jgi:Collagen triple helix repeat (20 copies)
MKNVSMTLVFAGSMILALTGCPGGGSSGSTTAAVTTPGTVSPNLAQVLSSAGCTVAQDSSNANSVDISCNGSTAVIQSVVGPVGPQGPQGQSITGPQGQQGLVGPQGIQGQQGLVGPQGIQGNPGQTGSVGPQGPAGSGGFTIKDAVGTMVGLSMGSSITNSGGNVVVYNSTAGVVAVYTVVVLPGQPNYGHATAQEVYLASIGGVYYTGANCTGSMYIGGGVTAMNQVLMFDPNYVGGEPTLYEPTGQQVASVTIYSYLQPVTTEGATPVCEEVSGGTVYKNVLPAQVVPSATAANIPQAFLLPLQYVVN